jgi:hypothetical protein
MPRPTPWRPPLATLALEPARALPRAPHAVPAGEQDTLPSRYGWPVHVLALAGFTLAFVGWLNETWLYLFDSPIWLNRYTEYAIILAFGTWRIASEKNAYTRRRLVILVGVVTGLWWLLPWLYPFRRAACRLPLVATRVPFAAHARHADLLPRAGPGLPSSAAA